MADFSIIPKFTGEAAIQLMAERIYDLEVTFGLTFKDGRYMKAPAFEEYIIRARSHYERQAV